MILPAALLVMGLSAVLAPALSARLGRRVGYVFAAVFLLVLGMFLTGAPEIIADEEVTFEAVWLPTLDIALRLRLDGLSLMFVTLVLGVGALIMSYCARYVSRDREHGRLYLLLILFATSMLGLVLASDVVLLYVFWELTTLCSFFLIGGQGLAGARPATRALVVTAGGGLALLAAVTMMSVVVGSTDLAAILEASDEIRSSPLAPWIGALVVLAAFTKSAQVPFHFWLPDAMVAITPVSAYLHAATLVKGGIYVLLRFSPLFAGTPGWTIALVSVGLTTAVVGAVFALQQHDLKALLAYSTVSQLGWIVTLIGVGTSEALAVAALHTFAHALFKATLFMLVGIIDREAGSRDIRDLSGLYRVMPVTATLTGLAALSLAGLPPFLGFVSKEEAYAAFLGLPGPVWAGPLVAGVAVVAAAITFAYGFRILYGAFGGRTRQENLYEPDWRFLAPAGVTAVGGLVLGLTVFSLNPIINRTVQDTLLRQGETDLALWHGFTPALWLSVASVAIGAALFAAKSPVDRALQRVDLRVTGGGVFDRLYAATLTVGSMVGRPARSSALAHHLVYPLAALVALAGAGVLVMDPQSQLPGPATRPADWVVVALLTVALLALCTTRSRLAAVSLLGAVGFLVGIWFVLVGGVDLALTQLLVEILTVVVAVLVLRRLPRRFTPSSRTRTATAVVVAAVTGAAAFGATLALTGRRELSTAGQFLLEQGPELSGGSNVVNTVLVDFRGLDTLGEATVLAVVALGLLTLLSVDRPPGSEQAEADTEPAHRLATGPPEETIGNATVFRVTSHLLSPFVVALSLWLLWRGHDAPGGGFIAALVGGAGVALTQLPHPLTAPSRLRPVPMVAVGLVVCIGTGLLGLLDGAFLRPLKGELVLGPLTQSLTTSLLFDLGVYLCVLGLVVAAIDRLGRGQTPPAVDADQQDRQDQQDQQHQPTAGARG